MAVGQSIALNGLGREAQEDPYLELPPGVAEADVCNEMGLSGRGLCPQQ